MVDGMMEGGKISPKKLSVTIISLKSPESSHLKRTIKDFTDGVIDVDEPPQEVGGEMDEGDKVKVKVDEEDGEENKKED